MNEPSSVSRLVSFGFSSYFETAFLPHRALGLEAARVALHHRGGYVLFTEAGELPADLAGRLRHDAESPASLPAVGDWVAVRRSLDGSRATILAVLPRRTAFYRGAVGGASEAQVVAANVDVVLLVCALGADRSARRLERYLTLARASGAEPVVVVTKADLDAHADATAERLRPLTLGAPLHVVSSVTGAGIDALRSYFAGHRTVAALGASGAGKSTLVNALTGGAMPVGPLAADGRGQHTTTHRELVLVPGGGLVVDTPGMRELRLWDADEGLEETFRDVSAIASGCRFRDCTHASEPGCAVRAALADGTLDPARWASHEKLEREVAALAQRTDARAASAQKQKMKVINRALRARYRNER